MATSRTNKVEVEIVANDEATPKIERLEKKIDGLEADEARITVSANTERLQSQLDAAKQKLDGLEGDEATVQARLIGNLETELEQAEALFRQLDGKTGTVRINANADDALADLDRVDDQVRQLDGRVARVGTTAGQAAGSGLAKAGGMAAIGAALVLSVEEAINLQKEIARIQQATGASTEDANRLVAVWKQNGQEVADLEDLLGNLNSVVADMLAEDEPGLADKLGLADATNGVDLFLQTAAGLSAIEDDMERARVAAQLFGEEGVRQVRDIEVAGGALQTQFDQISDSQLLDADQLADLKAANDELILFKGHLTEIEIFLATRILPMVNDIAAGIGTWFTAAAEFGAETNRVIDNTLGFVRDAIIDTGLGGSSGPGLTERSVIARNTGGFIGGASIGGMGGSLTAGAPGVRGANVTIVNPPGTPPATVDLSRLYDERNGNRS